jgi:hypothetical protein
LSVRFACVAILHYSTVDDAQKIWTGLTALIGVITGAFVSYFFTRGTVQAASQSADAAQQAVQVTQQSLQTAQQIAQSTQQNAMAQSNALSRTLNYVNDQPLADKILSDPVVVKALNMS